MGWCWPWRCKLRSLSPQRREDCGVSGEVFSTAGSRPGLAPRCSANSSSPLSHPPFLHLFLYSRLDASLPGWCGPNKTQPSGQRGNGTAASWASTSRPSTTLQTNSAMGHKPRATWNLSLPAVHCWFTPQNPSQAWTCTALDFSKFLSQDLSWENPFFKIMLYHQHIKQCIYNYHLNVILIFWKLSEGIKILWSPWMTSSSLLHTSEKLTTVPGINCLPSN